MAEILKNNSYMALPSSIKRGNPAAIDTTEVWYSQAEMEAYAKSNPVAYVGQKLSLVDEVAGTVKVYVIKNLAGDLDEIGSEVVNNITNITQEITNITENVTNLQADVSGLETDLAAAEEKISDLETSKANAADVYTKSEINTTVQSINDAIALKANAADVYTKTEVDNEINEAIVAAEHLRRKIVESVEAIDVNAEDALMYIYMVPTGIVYGDDKYDEYLVIEDGEERKVERVGSWEIDLSDYATVEALNTLSATVTANKTAIEEALADEVIRAKAAELANADAASEALKAAQDEANRAIAAEEALGARIDAIDFIDDSELTAALEPYAKTADVNSALELKANKATTLAGYGIVDAYTKEETLQKIEEKITEVNGGESAGEVLSQLNSYKEVNDARVQALEEKVETLDGAEANIINSVEETEFNLVERHLSIKEVAAAKVTGLAQHEALVALNDAIGVNTTAIANNKTALDEVTATLNNYVLLETYNAEMAEIKEAISWHNLG